MPISDERHFFVATFDNCNPFKSSHSLLVHGLMIEKLAWA
jgi:hypothetical protein